MSKLRIKPNYVLAFVVRGRQKYKGLYTPQKKSWAEFFDAIPVWIAQIGEECSVRGEGVGVGSKCFIRDAFELEPIPYSDFSSYPIPEACLQDAKDYDGYIELNVLHQDTLMGVEL